MKVSKLLLCVVLHLTSTLLIAQVYTYQDVDALIKKAERDSIAHIERMAALEFHELINQYRKQNDLKEIKWNETLWIATINHNTWMNRANDLAHMQKSNTKYFTGISPGNRLDYAAGGDASIRWSGENALYNFSCYGSTKEQIAKNIAKRSFEQWKNSPGHNKNMLGKSHGSHGVAFKIDNGKVWGTDLFSSAGYDYEPSPTTFYASKTKAKKSKKRFSTSRNKRMVHEEVITLLTDALSLRKRNFVNNGDARRKIYPLQRKKFKTAKTNGVLMANKEKITLGSFLGLFNKEEHTYSTVIEKPIDNFDSEAVSKELVNLIQENQPFTEKSKLDFAVSLKKQKDKVRITMVSIVYNPVGKLNRI